MHETNLPEDASVYARRFDVVFRYYTESIRAHLHALRTSGLLGEEPSETLLYASLFEIGCMQLYLLDHEFRHGSNEDLYLVGFWQQVAQWLLSGYPQITDKATADLLITWRLGKYEDMTRSIREDETYGLYTDTKIADYFFHLAEQLLLCLNADHQAGGETGLYLGIIDAEDFKDRVSREWLNAVTAVQNTLFDHALDLYMVGQQWAADGPYYHKTLELLEAGISLGGAAADDFRKRRRQLFSRLRSGNVWGRLHDADARFTWNPNVESSFERDETGLPHLRVTPDEEGFPIRWLLLFAYDREVGLVVKDEQTEQDVFLTLGGVIALLRLKETLGPHFLGLPDLSTPELLTTSLPGKWRLNTASCRAILGIYQVTEQPEPHLCWLAEEWEEKAGMLVFAPVPDTDFVALLQWCVPAGYTILGEERPNHAQYRLSIESEIGTEKSHFVYAPPYPNSKDVEAINEGTTWFVPRNEVLYGPGGESYELLGATADEDTGYTLLDLLLSCYDAGRGVLVQEVGLPLWSLTSGEVIQAIRDGKLVARIPDEEIPEDLSSAEHEQVFVPDYVDLPRSAWRNLYHCLREAGLEHPTMGLFNGEHRVILCIDAASVAKEKREPLRGRLAWHLPDIEWRLTENPILTPYRMNPNV